MKNEIKNELIKVLDIFQQAYIQRDVNKIDDFMSALFDKNEDVIVVGTSNGEWCLSYEEVKDIFISDWEYLRIKADEASIVSLANTALIYVPGTIKYTFYSNSNTYERYLGYIKQYFDQGSSNSKKSDKVKLTKINWILCHLLSQRDSNERIYLWDLRISFVLIKKETGWIIKQMQFSLPAVGHLPDVRIDNIDYDEESFNMEVKKLKNYSASTTSIYKDEITKLLQGFNNEYLDTDKDIDSVVNKYFAINNPLIINIDKVICSNQEEIKELIETHREYYDEIRLDCENCLINSNEEIVWIVTHGIMKKSINEENAFKNTINAINNIFASNLDDRDKLFNIRRKIADTLKENAKGEEYVWPFRFEGVLIKEKQQWVFKYLQFSLPFDYFLEGKTEAASILEKNI
ncbi:hypothetical protein [Clostridium peptidivorans]|uniref:hypothetical protein n=1 Tax=Clostridium peptidivorans TaxID=100174 RepID=UPI000BE34E49|nr:hypothetical protein [Clostridium peptidivorans]